MIVVPERELRLSVKRTLEWTLHQSVFIKNFTRIVFKALQSHTALEFDYEKFTSC